jgi:hypothetical protein
MKDSVIWIFIKNLEALTKMLTLNNNQNRDV